MFLLLTPFLAGILTVFAPCVLILLPVIVGSSLASDTDQKADRKKPYIISISLGFSVLLFTQLLKASTVLIGIDPQVWKSASGGIVAILGLSLFFPLMWARISAKIGLENSSNNLVGRAAKKSGMFGYVLTGAALGPVFSASYKKFGRWLMELMKRGIEQVVDSHPKDQEFKNWNGMKMAAAWPHGPGTPDRLGVIPTLRPTASQEEIDLFNALINERRAYAAKRINPLSIDGKVRYGCPALDGAVGCPLRPETMATAVKALLPIVTDVPDEVGRPKICTQESVQIRITNEEEEIAMKLHQRFYWGSKSWRLSYARRTFVESWFGVLKNTSSTGFHRGSHQFVGLPLVTLVVAMAVATTNLRLLRTWHKRTGFGDTQHPLLQPEGEDSGYTRLTREQADAIDARRLKEPA